MTTQNSILRLPQVIGITGLARSTIFAHISQGRFPKQIKLGPHAAGWLAADVQRWIDGRIAASVQK